MKRILLVLIVPVLLLSVASCHHGEHAKEEEATFKVTTPIKKDTTVFKEYVAQIRSSQHIELRALEKGYLQSIYVDEGQFVKKGQLMFKIMPLIYQAEMEKAQAEADFAEIEYQNTKSLADNNVVSQKELALGKAKLDKAKAELNLAKAHLSFTDIKAPFDGIMDHFHVRLGSLVDEGELISTLSDNASMWVYFNVPEAEYLDFATRAKADQPLNVNLQLANHAMFDHAGKVETIEADFDNETGNIEFRATFPNPKRILRHGETGNVMMPVHVKNAVLIPQKATFEVLDKKYVFVVGKDGVVHSKEITIGQELPHIYAVTGGLSLDDHILIDGLRKVKNNDKIKVEMEDPEKVLNELNDLHAE